MAARILRLIVAFYCFSMRDNGNPQNSHVYIHEYNIMKYYKLFFHSPHYLHLFPSQLTYTRILRVSATPNTLTPSPRSVLQIKIGESIESIISDLLSASTRLLEMGPPSKMPHRAGLISIRCFCADTLDKPACYIHFNTVQSFLPKIIIPLVAATKPLLVARFNPCDSTKLALP